MIDAASSKNHIYIYIYILSHEQNSKSVFKVEPNRFWNWSFPSPRLDAIPRLKSQSALLFTHCWMENIWIHTLTRGIMWNPNNFVQYIYIYIFLFPMRAVSCYWRSNSRWRLHKSVIFWPSTRPKNAIPRWCTGRKWHIPLASNRKRSRGRIKAYNMGQGEGPTVPLQWYTGREWPVNCMTVISAWWRLNIRFQRSSGRSCGRWIII